METRFLKGIAWTREQGHDNQWDEPWWFPVIAYCRGQFFYHKHGEKFILSHEGSGLIVTRFRTRKSCEECILELEDVPFWNGIFPIDEEFQRETVNIIQQDHIRHNRCW